MSQPRGGENGQQGGVSNPSERSPRNSATMLRYGDRVVFSTEHPYLHVGPAAGEREEDQRFYASTGPPSIKLLADALRDYGTSWSNREMLGAQETTEQDPKAFALHAGEVAARSLPYRNDPANPTLPSASGKI